MKKYPHTTIAKTDAVGVMLKMLVILINKTKRETKMVKENKTESVEEPTIKFADDGVEHKVNDMPDEAKQLMFRWQEKKRIRDEFIIKANNDIDDLNILLSSYEARMKNIVEPAEDEPKIEVQ
jgi:hypothetical protein